MIANAALALASAALLVLLFPGFNYTWLAPVALTPLLIACAREPDWRLRLGLGYLSGVAFFAGLCNWIHWPLVRYAGMSSGVAWLVFALLCLAKAPQLGVFAGLAGPLLQTRFAAPCVAALWVAIEWTGVYTGFEWLNLGNAGSGMSVPLRLAPVTGVWGLSFAFALMAAVIAAAILRRRRFVSLWLLLLAPLALLPDLPSPRRGDASAVLLQPNMADDIVWSPELVRGAEEHLATLSLSPLLTRDNPANVIVWPEMPAPFFDDDPAFLNTVSAVAKTTNAAVLTGDIGRAADRRPLNSALLTGPDGERVSRYDKVNLVPFGEFVPWPFGAVAEKISSGAGDFEPGSKIVVSQLGAHRIGTFICYESVFPNYIRQLAMGGAEALFTLSNDSWFGHTQARYQHLLLLRMRAAENHRWIVRGTNDGVTAVIDPAGRVVRAAPEFQEVTVRMLYGYSRDLTFYARFGDWFVLVCGVVALAGLALSVAGNPRWNPLRRSRRAG